MASAEPFALPVAAAQPGQCYLDGRELSLATRRFDFDDPEYDPIPVRELDGEWVVPVQWWWPFIRASSRCSYRPKQPVSGGWMVVLR